MPNLPKILFIALLTTAACAANAETGLITQQGLEGTLELARTAYLDKNYQAAAEQYAKAAMWGDKHSQFVLGNMYKTGLGIKKDAITAYAWMATAAENRDKDFRRATREMFEGLSSAEQQQAEALTATLISKYGMKATGVTCKKDGRTGSNIKSTFCQHANLTANGDIIVPVYDSDALAGASGNVSEPSGN